MKSFSLTDHFLIAMPSLADSLFEHAVVYLCEHTERGAMGVVVNRPSDMTLSTLFEQVHLPLGGAPIGRAPLYLGGPVQTDRGFVLHQPLGQWQSTLTVNETVGLTTSKDVLSAICKDEGPEQVLISLGYAGWGAGQLERELASNAWLTLPAHTDVIFSTPPEARFAAALRLLGIDPLALSAQAGHA